LQHFGHGGSIKGVSANFQVMMEKDMTACLLINMADVPAEDILLSSLATILEIPKVTKTLDKIRPLNDKALQLFAGFYQSKEGNKVTVTSIESRLHIHQEDKVVAVYPISEMGFQSEDGTYYHFTKHNDKVTGVYIGKRLLPKVE